MNLDPFGHMAHAVHSGDRGRQQLSRAKSVFEKKIWSDYINWMESFIKRMEKSEMEYWLWMTGRI